MNTTEATTHTATKAHQSAHVAPKETAATNTATRQRVAPKARRCTKKSGARKPAGKNAAVPREFSKKAIVIEMLGAKGGATMTAIAKATGWQNHSIRGFISGRVAKRMGLAVDSTKNASGERNYRIAVK